MPLEADVKTVRDYTVSRLQEIVNDPFSLFDSHLYVELRDLLVCRLTLFNATRGGEPCRLSLCEWKDAEGSVWIDPGEVEKVDNALDKSLAKDIKIAYQTGKGNKHLVPVLYPDTVEPLKKIANEENRLAAGISQNNPYVFASTQNSLYHVSGWHAVHSVCEKLELEKDICLQLKIDTE
ncbi:hypothetical protein BSL78_18948 [Apostichopus japonicus]|uniref:Uncharacterized protein n=1 Tax=Stichopus japonicus TaxID=307972 RepID=A0A2G8K875_STIJA|nr:hypothetical protein BSL78_18948 [Apostichopus japonicus]